MTMPSHQQRFDDAMYAFSQGDFAEAVARLRAILAEDPGHFDAQLALGMALCRLGDFAGAVAEGHKAERLRPDEQLVHTNLSLFYLKAGDKAAAEHHGARAKIAAWKTELAPKPGAAAPPAAPGGPPAARPPLKLPDMPWKKKP
jgi:Flp pilus assembly protein TadD